MSGVDASADTAGQPAVSSAEDKQQEAKDVEEYDGEKEPKRLRVDVPTVDGVEVPEKLRGFIERLDPCRVVLKRGLAKDMRVEGMVFANEKLLPDAG